MKMKRKTMSLGHVDNSLTPRFEDQKQQLSSSLDNSCGNSFHNNNNSSHTIRVCAYCNTTKTPCWRRCPRGAKFLCNACGIRQRKEKKAMDGAVIAVAEARGDGSIFAAKTTPSGMKSKVQEKAKRSRTNRFALQLKNKTCKLSSKFTHEGRKKLPFEDLRIILMKNSAFHRVFAEDEKEAPILLMALSYGVVYEMSTPKTLNNPFEYEELQTERGVFWHRRNPSLPYYGKRKGKRKLKPGKFVGVSQRSYGRYCAEIRDSTTKKKRYWLGTFDSAQKAAIAYDRAALSMKGRQTKFIYPDYTSSLPLFFPFDVQEVLPTSEQFLSTSEPKKETNPHSTTTYHQPDISHSQMLIQSNNNNNNYPSSLAHETAYGLVDDSNSFFSMTDHSKSDYLASIVPDNYLKALSTTQTSSSPSYISNFCSINENSRSHVENDSHCDSYAVPYDITSFSKINDLVEFSGFEQALNQCFSSHEQQSWEMNCNELLPVINNTPLMVKEGCMRAFYPYNESNPSYSMIPQTTSYVTCSPSLPLFGNVVDLGYSLF